MGTKMWMAVVWPAFLAACVLEAVVFAVVDPHDLSWGGGPLGWSRQAVYTASFFLFWLVCIGSSLLAWVLARPEAAPGRHD